MVKQNKNIINHIQHIRETSLTNKLQDISKTQDPSTRSFQGPRSEDRIVCKIGIVDCSIVHALFFHEIFVKSCVILPNLAPNWDFSSHYRDQNLLDQIFFWPNFFQILFHKIFIKPEKFWTKNFFGPKIFWRYNFFEPEILF